MNEKKQTSGINRTTEEKLAFQNDLIHMAVHDLKGPLMEIIANIDLVVNSKNIPEDERDFASTAMQGCNDMYSLVMDMLDLGKLEAGVISLKREKCDIGEIVSKEISKFSLTAEERSIKINLKTEGDVFAQVDHRLIGRVIANLTSNGLKFSETETSLDLSVSQVGDSVKVTVRDRGPGVPAEYKEKVFDKYFQVELRTHQKKGGTGLGLPFCKMAIEAHGGKIGISNMPDGTEFHFIIPKNG